MSILEDKFEQSTCIFGQSRRQSYLICSFAKVIPSDLDVKFNTEYFPLPIHSQGAMTRPRRIYCTQDCKVQTGERVIWPILSYSAELCNGYVWSITKQHSTQLRLFHSTKNLGAMISCCLLFIQSDQSYLRVPTPGICLEVVRRSFIRLLIAMSSRS